MRESRPLFEFEWVGGEGGWGVGAVLVGAYLRLGTNLRLDAYLIKYSISGI